MASEGVLRHVHPLVFRGKNDNKKKIFYFCSRRRVTVGKRDGWAAGHRRGTMTVLLLLLLLLCRAGSPAIIPISSSCAGSSCLDTARSAGLRGGGAKEGARPSHAAEESIALHRFSPLAAGKAKAARIKCAKKRDAVGILCYRCRRSGSTMSQRSIIAFCRGGTSAERTGGGAAATDQLDSAILVCRQCRRPMEESAPVSNANSRIAMTRTCPSITKLRGYKRVAAEKNIEWRILESEAQRIMSLPCAFCGRLARDNPGGFNGINRVNHSLQVYDHDNVAPACADCNTMKHDYSSGDFVRICRHVATFQGLGNFSLFPEVFRNASSRRGRRSLVCSSCMQSVPRSVSPSLSI